MADLKRKTNIVLYKITAIGLSSFLIFLFLNILLGARLSLVIAAMGDKLEAICGCTNHWSFGSHPWMFSFLIITTAIILTFISFAFIKIVRLKIKTDRFVKASLVNRKAELSGKLGKVARSLNLEKRIVEVRSSNPTVFCHGFMNSKICISSAFVKKLNGKELAAVLLHEQYHLMNHETIKLFIIKTITAILFFVPGLKSLSEQYSTLSEVSADEWAIRNSQNKTYLAGAIYKVLELKEKMVLKNHLAIASFSRVTEERIKKIADDNYIIRVNIIKPKLLMNLLLMSAVLFMFSFFIYSSKTAIASHDNNICSMNHSQEHQGCEMLNDGSLCEMQHDGVLLNNIECGQSFQKEAPYGISNYGF